jgi:16S rRNA (uracil1498-N3)-methyltransferase
MVDDDKYRFYCEGLAVASVVELSTAESHHAMHVLRLGVGAQVELFDGRGQRSAGRIAQAKHGKVSVEVTGPVSASSRPVPVIHLAMAIPKGKRLDWLLEKATELGAASLTAVRFERSVSGGEPLGESARERWRTHCIAAAKQCGLDFLPEIHDPLSLQAFLAAPAAGPAVRLVGDLGEGAVSLPHALSEWKPDQQPVTVLVGPEGGFTPAEREAILASGFVPVRLGSTVLRIETAALALLAGVLAQR